MNCWSENAQCGKLKQDAEPGSCFICHRNTFRSIGTQTRLIIWLHQLDSEIRELVDSVDYYFYYFLIQPMCTLNGWYVVVVQSLSCVWLFVIPWTTAHQASLSFTISQILLKLMSTESVMPSNHLILCRPLLLLPSIFPSIRVLPNQSVLWIRWPKYWRFSFNISPPNEYSALISFRMDWFDLLTVQGTLKSLLYHHSLKASILQCSAFFMIQLSHPYMTTGKKHSFD